ncbi:large T antigen [Rhinolophus affinis polyomavirus 2]|nr:large T antigen [Rhinolophus affinis polyomavirus 2]
MDRFLSRDEMKELMELLHVPAHCYGNLAMMKINYKKMSKIYHPDKGGDAEKMKRMNELWQKMADNICSARQESGYQVSAWLFGDLQTCRDFLGPKFKDRVCKDYPNCVLIPKEECTCLVCMLARQHRIYKIWKRQPCMSEDPSCSGSMPRPPYGSDTWEQWWNDFNRGWDDLFCSEHMDSSDEDDRSGQPGSSQGSFATPPKAKKPKTSNVPTDFPSELDNFLSHAVYSNKTVSAFLIYTTKEKAEFLYEKLDKYKPEFKSRHSYEDYALLFLITPGKHRVSALKNFCLAHCTVSFLLCKAVIKPAECYSYLCVDPFKKIEANKPGVSEYEFYEGERAPTVDWNKIADFAVETRLEDPLLIMAFYLDFSKDPDACPKCNSLSMKMHYKYHPTHYKNALLFKDCKTQKTVCQQAADVVVAKTRLKLLESSREDLLAERMMVLFERLADEYSPDTLFEWMAGVAWYTCLFDDIEDKLFKILQLLVENVPKKRNILFRGPINTGKTTFAAAILDLVGGKTLNINCPAEKLGFELGCAIDQFAVIFEDVKGQTGWNKSLHPGQGVANLDNLRDYLDGSVRVNLEKKHVNKKSQIFPPSIVTMNEYMLPQTLLTRFSYRLCFVQREYLQKSLEDSETLGKKRILQSGGTLLLLLLYHLPTRMFNKSLHEQVTNWKETIDKCVGLGKFLDMKNNVMNGKDPLLHILYEEEEEEETETQTTN